MGKSAKGGSKGSSKSRVAQEGSKNRGAQEGGVAVGVLPQGATSRANSALQEASLAAGKSYSRHEDQVKAVLSSATISAKLRDQKAKIKGTDLSGLSSKVQETQQTARLMEEIVDNLQVIAQELDNSSKTWESELSRLVMKENTLLKADLETMKGK